MEYKYEKEFRTAMPETIGETDREYDVCTYAEFLEANLKDRDEKYSELIMAVESKRPNQTRHETALSYIRNAEKDSAVASTQPPKQEES